MDPITGKYNSADEGDIADIIIMILDNSFCAGRAQEEDNQAMAIANQVSSKLYFEKCCQKP